MKGKRARKAVDEVIEQPKPTPVVKLKSVSGKGFEMYGVKWNPEKVNFKVESQETGIHFYGWWRKSKVTSTQELVYCIDIYAVREGKDFTVKSITYYETDPREQLKSLNADIIAVLNRWFHENLRDDVYTIDHLLAQAKHPSLKITRLSTIDNLILRLREYRDTAIRAGGQRIVELRGDTEAPPVMINMDLSAAAYALKGRPPAIDSGMGLVVDTAGENGNRRKDMPRPTRAVHIPDAGNVSAIVKQLQDAKASGDEAMARKLRATLRKMGHKGGARLVNAKEAAEKLTKGAK